MPDLLVGRQPIFNRNLDVIAYELLYRSTAQPDRAHVVDGDRATTQVILNAFSEIGLEKLVGDKTAFINFTKNLLVDRNKYPIPFPPDRVILEVLEDVPVDPQLLAALTDLISKGYWLALDDVVSYGQAVQLIHMAKIVKLDLMGIERRNLKNLVYQLKQYNVQLLAEKVETQEEYDLCCRLGFDLFQGYFLCKPTIIRGRRLDASRLVLLQSLAKLQEQEKDFKAIEMVIGQDVTLGYKLLKLVNSGYYSLQKTINSIGQAIAMIGFDQVRGWITLLLMAAVDNKPHELTVIALQRARMCEMFARAKHYQQPETYFMTGLLSVLDALMDISMDQVVNSVPLAPEVADGLLTRKGRHGEILNAATAYEQCDWDTVDKLNLGLEKINKIYLEALYWTKRLTDEIENVKG